MKHEDVIQTSFLLTAVESVCSVLVDTNLKDGQALLLDTVQPLIYRVFHIKYPKVLVFCSC